MITTAYPDLAAIPYAQTGRPITGAQTSPRWLGEFKSLIFFLSPGWLRSLYKKVSNRILPSGQVNSVENEWWSSVLEQANTPKTLKFPEGEFRLTPNSSTHAKSVFLGLNWTQEYLNRDEFSLQHAPTGN
jgi:hypothetical protein